jgi:hypothetical protein
MIVGTTSIGPPFDDNCYYHPSFLVTLSGGAKIAAAIAQMVRQQDPYARHTVVYGAAIVSGCFTSFEKPRLISIGLVTLNREEFYAEVEYDLEACSGYVRTTVIPLLSDAGKCSLAELKARLSRWIGEIGKTEPVALSYDSQYDRMMLEPVFGNDFPDGVSLQNLGASYISKNGSMSTM